MSHDLHPFRCVEEAWFWFIQANKARNEGARIQANMGRLSRPCEPVDILKVIDRLYRNRRLNLDHLHVLRHYGNRMVTPDPSARQERRSYDIWREAMDRMEPILIRKGIVEKPPIEGKLQ